jgi:hypothetical protein
MDVLCVGMYRACSTWQYEVAADLVEGRLGGERLGYLTGDEYAALPEANGWRVLKSHEGHPAFRRALAAGRAVALASVRDPRDVVYSMLHKRSQSFRVFLREGMIHQLVANDRAWARQPASRRITQRYEALVEDPERGIAEIADFLGIEVGIEEVARLAAEYSLEANRRRALATARRLSASGIDLSDPAQATRHDERSLLHWNHVRRGQVGDWRARAAPMERRVMNRLLGTWINRNGYEPDRLEDLPPESIRARAEREADQAIGWARCRLRCAALNHPRAGRLAKRWLGISP